VSWIGVLFAALVTPLALTVLILRAFPKFFADALLKTLEHRQNKELERLRDELSRESAGQVSRVKADIEASYRTLESSAAFLAASQQELRIKSIAATEHLWETIVNFAKEFQGLVFFETILTPTEIADCFKTDNWKKWDYIREYATDTLFFDKFQKSGAGSAEKDRLFVHDRLWMHFYILRMIYGRVAYLYVTSFKKHEYVNWRQDTAIKQLLGGVIPAAILETEMKSNIGGLQRLIWALESEFLKEAMKVMSGTRVFAESIGDMQSNMLTEKMTIGARLTLDKRGAK